MLVECRFCLEEVEVDDLQFNTIKHSKDGSEAQESAYIELTPITANKRHRKNLGNRLVRPCDCKGTQRHVHVKCLCEWIGKCNKWYCGICHRVYNLSPHHLHYCVMKLQRRGVLKNLPPIYSSSEFSRSSYFALLIFMGTLSMLMLPSTIPEHNSKTSFTNTHPSTTHPKGFPYSSPNSYINFYPSSSSPSIYSSAYAPPTNSGGGMENQGPMGGLASEYSASFNSQLSSIFSSCQLKYPDDEKFSSFVCHSNLFLPTNFMYNNKDNSHHKGDSNNNLTGNNGSNNADGVSNALDNNKQQIPNNKHQGAPSQWSYLSPEEELFLKLNHYHSPNLNYIHNIQNYQYHYSNIGKNPKPFTMSNNNNNINNGGERNQFRYHQNIDSSPLLDHQIPNIYIPHQKYHRVSITDSMKNIFCNLIPIEQFCQ
ncbi:hypothetical protein CYY_004235 [Polysphondylium violaceum]|uniref:RING-CH-type domain-containing protein n=1 Tax=Polysphondylium violaceum TaxID=133409 RepID=A0A8J4PUX2_9MYCE|nr:hypothetical protein CYY_004235 [Polysphondylium violaceum]